jgi:hypothetical protein
MKYKGYEIRQARDTGGKAGAGRNATSSLQVIEREPGQYIQVLKSVRYLVGNSASLRQAYDTAKRWIDNQASTK